MLGCHQGAVDDFGLVFEFITVVLVMQIWPLKSDGSRLLLDCFAYLLTVMYQVNVKRVRNMEVWVSSGWAVFEFILCCFGNADYASPKVTYLSLY